MLASAADTLAKAGIDTARLDAEVLLAHCCGISRLTLLSELDLVISASVAAAFNALINRRCTYEPVAYLTGRAEFWSLDFKVTPDVLIPRADSEVLVEAALERLPARAAGRVADLGTGSGCLALAVLTERGALSAELVDISEAALDVVRSNAATLGLSQRATFRQMAMQDWLLNAFGFDLIISNPPYISPTHFQSLPPDVAGHEPKSALLAGQDGLEFYEYIAKLSPRAITPTGSVIVEIGFDQASAVQALFDCYFKDVSCRQDLAGRDRLISARNPR